MFACCNVGQGMLPSFTSPKKKSVSSSLTNRTLRVRVRDLLGETWAPACGSLPSQQARTNQLSCSEIPLFRRNNLE